MERTILTERASLFDPNIYVAFLFEIKGNPTDLMLKSAIMQAYNANESTMCKIVIGADGNAAYIPINECRCTVTITSEHWQDIIKANEKRPFHIENGELIRSFIIKSDNKTFILIMAHHLVGDGKSIIYFIEDFMNSLKGDELPKKPMILFTKDMLSQICKIPLPTRLYASSFNKKWRKYNKCFSTSDYYRLHNSYWENHTSVILQERYTKEELLKLHQKSKEYSLSINNLMISAFQKANPNYSKVGIAVNGRINNNKSISNQATGISVDVKYKAKRTVLENAKVTQKKVQRKLKSPFLKYFILQFMSILSPTLVDSILFHINGLFVNPVSSKLADVLGYTYKKDHLLSITNLTKLDIPHQYGQFQIKDMWFIPPVVSYGQRIIGIVSDNDGMSISYHFMNDLDLKTEKAFFNLANANLREIIV